MGFDETRGDSHIALNELPVDPDVVSPCRGSDLDMGISVSGVILNDPVPARDRVTQDLLEFGLCVCPVGAG